jgi:ABC-type glycerol-3-phosphate transport system permease component
MGLQNFLLITALFILIPILNVIADSLDENAAVEILGLIPEDWTITVYKLILSQKTLAAPFLISLFVTTTEDQAGGFRALLVES